MQTQTSIKAPTLKSIRMPIRVAKTDMVRRAFSNRRVSGNPTLRLRKTSEGYALDQHGIEIGTFSAECGGGVMFFSRFINDEVWLPSEREIITLLTYMESESSAAEALSAFADDHDFFPA